MSTFYCDLELYDDCMICGSRHELRLLDDGQSICDSCLDVVSEVHTIKARPTGKKHLHACDICEGKGYNLNSLSPDGDVLPWPVAAVCWSCGGIGKR